jgi:GNAT superfamily N-acetyltransferase
MTAALTLAQPDHLEQVQALVSAFHEECKHPLPEAQVKTTLAPLLAGSPHGAVYLIGPGRAPVGYIAISFGWQIDQGGLVGTITELFIRQTVRGRGLAGEVLLSLPAALGAAGVAAVYTEVSPDMENLHRLFARAGFKTCPITEKLARRLAPAH